MLPRGFSFMGPLRLLHSFRVSAHLRESSERQHTRGKAFERCPSDAIEHLSSSPFGRRRPVPTPPRPALPTPAAAARIYEVCVCGV